MQLLRYSHPSLEGVFNASKWLKHPFLIDEEEMRALLAYLGEFAFYQVSCVVQVPTLSKEIFLEKYSAYLADLKEGRRIERKFFSLALSVTPDAFYALPVKEEGSYLVKQVAPVVQMQAHHFFPSGVDGKFYTMVSSQESLEWGLQCSYPQIFEHPHTYTFSKITDSPAFPNTQLFTKLAKWLRQETVPTTFVWKDQKISTSFRLGKNCFSWIHTHPQLKGKGITVHVY